MKPDFNEIPEKVLPHSKGGEQENRVRLASDGAEPPAFFAAVPAARKP